jgi:hypothetical protein
MKAVGRAGGRTGAGKGVDGSKPAKAVMVSSTAAQCKKNPHRRLSDFYQAEFNTALDPYP